MWYTSGQDRDNLSIHVDNFLHWRGKVRRRIIVPTATLILAMGPLFHAATPSYAANCTTQASPCKVGDVGPGGGVVFLTPDSKGNPTGKYFEVAKPTWSPVRTRKPLCDGPADIAGTKSSIGSGELNTKRISEWPGCESGAAADVMSYAGGGFNDWFLPSSDELNEIWRRIVRPRATKRDWTGSGSNDFISSTAGGSWVQSQYMKTNRPSSGKRGGIMKYDYAYNYWPVRMFSLRPATPSATPVPVTPEPKPNPVFN